MSLPITTFNETGLNSGVVISAGQAFVDRLANVVGAPPNPDRPSDPSAEEREQREIVRLRSKGREYIVNEMHWRFLMAAYEGGPTYVSESTLFKHQREHGADFADRLKRAHYQNYCQPLVDFVPEYIFSQGVERHPNKELETEFELFKQDCDGAGTTLDAFMQARGEDIRIFGMSYVQVDKVKLPDGVSARDVSVARAKELGVNAPYLIAINPLEILKSTADSRGNFTYLKRAEFIEVVDAFGYLKPYERYTEWTPQLHRVSLIDVSDPKKPQMAQWGQPVANDLGRVPFIPLFFKRAKSNKDLPQSFLTDIAYQNRHVFNLTSLLDEFLFRQCFNVLVMPMKTQVPTREQVEGDMGSSNVLEVPSDSNHKPEYLSPPVEPAKFIQEERASTVHEMYRQAAQDVMQELITTRQSGDAQKQGFSRTIPVINKTADTLEFAEQRIMTLWGDLQGEKWTGKISYKDDYSITNLLDLLLQLGQIFNTIKLNASPTFVREEWRRVVREFDGKIDKDTMDKILLEIAAIKDADIKQMFMSPQDLQATLGVPSTADMTQGKNQTLMGTDKKISAGTGSQAHSKEAAPDKNKRAKTGS